MMYFDRISNTMTFLFLVANKSINSTIKKGKTLNNAD